MIAAYRQRPAGGGETGDAQTRYAADLEALTA